MVTLPICSFSDKYVLTLCLYYCLSFSSSVCSYKRFFAHFFNI